MIHRRSLLLLACATAALLVRCSPTQIAGSGSGSEVVGFLVDGKGNRIAGATVVADTAQVQKDSTSILDTAGLHRADTLSDAAGRFVLHHLDTTGGVYNIRCSYNKGALVALIPDVKVVTFDTDLGVDTMYPPGSISGRVVLGGGPDAGVFCYVPGTSFIAMSNDTGGFTISGVPKGVYKVYFYFPGYLVAVDSQVTVVSGQVTNVGATGLSLDPTGAPPPPAGLSATVDTADGIVRLSWDSVMVSDLVGYRVYRRDSADTGYSVIGSSAPITDTFFVDTVYKNSQDSLVHDYSYVVKAFDVETNASAFSNLVSVRTVPPSSVRTVFWLTMPFPASDTASAGDTVRIAARFSSGLTKTDTVTWFTGTPGSAFLKKTWFGAKQGNDTLSYAWTASGSKEVYIQALDERGMVWLDSIHLVVRPRAVDVVTVRSTDSSCTVLWRASAEPAFKEYRLLVSDTAAGTATVVADSEAGVQDTAFTIITWKNGPKKYSVIVAASNGLVSNPGKASTGAIVNTPPRFLADSATISKIANVGTTYVVKLAVVDVNEAVGKPHLF